MASVSNLDQDMRNLRMSRYTPAAADEARVWIEATLGERLPSGDLLEALKDGVALCKLASLVLPGIKYKSSAMPFIQMENISHFLKACEMPPLQLPAHDRFLTVDLFESKDPAQVLQCLGAFSRQAHAIKPTVFRTTIGPKKASGGGSMSPATTGNAGATNGGAAGWRAGAGRSPSPTKFSAAMPSNGRALSPSYTGDSQGSRASASKSPPGPVSSWSRKTDETSTAPAWNIHQYGYMGGASQGNQGVSFGSRRQIISNAPDVPSLAEKEKMRKEKAAEEERRRQEAQELERRRKLEQDAEESRARVEEERRWEDETRRAREEEKRRVEEQKRQWEEQELRWKQEEESRRKEDAQMQSLQKTAPEKPRVPSSTILRGQTLSQYQRDLTSQASGATATTDAAETPEQARVRDLERQLEEARERERQYQVEREQRLRQGSDRSRPGTSQNDGRPQSAAQSDKSWAGDEREFLRSEWQNNRAGQSASISHTNVVDPQSKSEEPGPLPPRPLPQPSSDAPQPARPTIDEQPPALPQRMQPSVSASSIPSHVSQETSTISSSPLGSPNRPLPTPDKEYQPYTTPTSGNRTDRYLATNNAPVSSGPRISSSAETGDTSLEQQRDRDARVASQQKTKAGGWASKSLLEREMERERERQREWEADQERSKTSPRDASQGVGAGQSWDVNQYGFMGGDNMNRGSGAGSGINIGAGRRQILGPREMGNAKK